MKLSLATIALLACLLAFGLGCDGGGNGSNDPCDDVCDEIRSCDFDGYDNDDCDDFCDEVNDIRDQVSVECEDAIYAVLACAAGTTCDELENTLELEPIEVLAFTYEECTDELETLRDECDEFVED